MAFTERMATRTYISGAPIAQFLFVAGPASDGQIDPCGDGARGIGVALTPATAAGQAVTVAYDGRVTVTAGGNITRGGAVASDANGKAVAAAATDVILGYTVEAAINNQIITIELSRAETAAA
ncbi:Bacteriophage VT1-Sakai, H0018 [uncultured Caudovirales phage]|uniref:Bacteriophage VT1-Sakai, H0018 n=1 Tax=uncultured Caudovirales phage TaxID=2100421 RepID=A0A6J5M3B9_9CAUD|nr:Bacteriophage VT1-Sakai, H0018 [uncultured Caudovirales phage]